MDDDGGMWVAHEKPERPLGYGAWLCCCPACRLAVLAGLARRPVTLVLKTGLDRIKISAKRALEVWGQTGCLESELRLRGDWLREIFVAAHPLPRKVDRWSLTEEKLGKPSEEIGTAWADLGDAWGCEWAHSPRPVRSR